MKRIAIALLALLATPAFAKDVSVTLTDEEQTALRQIFDLALRQGGLRISGNVSYLMQKLAPPEPAPTSTPVPTQDIPAPKDEGKSP